MPITKSAKKSLKVSRTKAVQNQIWKNKLRKAVKKADGKNINTVISTIDKSAKVGIISKEKAARFKSRLNKKFGAPKKEKTTVKPVAKVVKKEATKKSPAKKPVVKAKK